MQSIDKKGFEDHDGSRFTYVSANHDSYEGEQKFVDEKIVTAAIQQKCGPQYKYDK